MHAYIHTTLRKKGINAKNIFKSGGVKKEIRKLLLLYQQ